jgi:hypothetical protein
VNAARSSPYPIPDSPVSRPGLSTPPGVAQRGPDSSIDSNTCAVRPVRAVPAALWLARHQERLEVAQLAVAQAVIGQRPVTDKKVNGPVKEGRLVIRADARAGRLGEGNTGQSVTPAMPDRLVRVRPAQPWLPLAAFLVERGPAEIEVPVAAAGRGELDQGTGHYPHRRA